MYSTNLYIVLCLAQQLPIENNLYFVLSCNKVKINKSMENGQGKIEFLYINVIIKIHYLLFKVFNSQFNSVLSFFEGVFIINSSHGLFIKFTDVGHRHAP